MNSASEQDATNAIEQLNASELGKNVRKIRKAMGLTIRALGANTGMSIGMISQIEQGKSTPSLKSLRLVSEALQVPISTFFNTGTTTVTGERHIVRKSKRQVLKLNGAVLKELMSPSSLQDLEIFNVELSPGGASSVGSYSHSGEKAGIVIAGTLTLWLNEEMFLLEAGDTCQFPGKIPHRYANQSDTVCKVIWVLTLANL